MACVETLVVCVGLKKKSYCLFQCREACRRARALKRTLGRLSKTVYLENRENPEESLSA